MIFWGTFFPLISEAFTGDKSSLGPPWFDQYTTPLAIVLVLFTGIGPLLAWRKVSAGVIWRLVRAPLAVAAVGDRRRRAVHRRARPSCFALVMFAFAFFALAALVAEFLRGASAQRALTGGSWPTALARVTARNRRRYGGYIVHAGIAILFIAVAASSSFQNSSDMRLQPGESGTVGDYTVTYVTPTSSDRRARSSGSSFGAVISVDRDGKQVALLAPSRNYYSSTAAEGTIRGFFEGEATSEVGRQTKFGGDIWSAMRPDLTRYDDFIDEADRRIAYGRRRRSVPALANLQGLAIQNLAKRYHEDGPAGRLPRQRQPVRELDLGRRRDRRASAP